MGTCFGTIFDVTIGDIDPAETGSASGSLNAIQQLAGRRLYAHDPFGNRLEFLQPASQ